MSLQDLNRMGLLRDEDEWDGRQQRTGVFVPAMLAAAVIGAVGCLAMVLGDGGRATWVGVAAFLLALFAFTGLNLRAVGRRPSRPG